MAKCSIFSKQKILNIFYKLTSKTDIFRTFITRTSIADKCITIYAESEGTVGTPMTVKECLYKFVDENWEKMWNFDI